MFCSALQDADSGPHHSSFRRGGFLNFLYSYHKWSVIRGNAGTNPFPAFPPNSWFTFLAGKHGNFLRFIWKTPQYPP